MSKPTWMAFPGERGEPAFVGLEIPREMIPPLPPNATGHIIRIKSADGFRNFLMAAVDAATLVWPEIAQDFKDANEVDS